MLLFLNDTYNGTLLPRHAGSHETSLLNLRCATSSRFYLPKMASKTLPGPYALAAQVVESMSILPGISADPLWLHPGNRAKPTRC